MSDYTITNLKQVDDAAEQFGLSPNIEARFARKALESTTVAVSYQRLAPGFRIPWGHRHANQEEIYVVLSGGGRMKLDDDVVEVGQWDAVRVTAETMRGFEAGPEGAELLAVGAPIAAENDVEMVQGWWSD
jgi:mannose-6-phosphate isomerase-like protein (cupin superfamily)